MSDVSLPQLVRSEFTKFRSVRSSYVTVALTFALTVGLGALVSYLAHNNYAKMSLPERMTFNPVELSLVGTLLGQFVVGVLGALSITSEFATGSIRTSLAASPHRVQFVLAKAGVVKVVILVASLASVFAAFFLGQSLIGGNGVPSAAIDNPGVLRAVLLGGLYLVLASLMGFSLGLIIRHTAGTISVYVSLLLVLPLITAFLPTSWRDAIAKYLPSSLGRAMMSVAGTPTEVPLFSPWVATGVLVAIVTVMFCVGTYLFARRDV